MTISDQETQKMLLSKFDSMLQNGRLSGRHLFKNMLALSVLDEARVNLSEEQVNLRKKARDYIEADGECGSALQDERSTLTARIAAAPYGSPESTIDRLLTMALSDPEDADIDDLEYILEWANALYLGSDRMLSIAEKIISKGKY